MSSNTPANGYRGITLRQAALVAGFAYLLNPVSYAEFSIYPKLVAAIEKALGLEVLDADSLRE